MSEHSEQVCVFEWAAWASNQYPQLDLMFSIPNGGARHIAVATKLKKEGVKKGVPDICLPYPCKGFHGLFIEMKFGKNKPTIEQNKYMNHLLINNYFVEICYSCEQAIKTIKDYLNVR